jgi:hypothetical protein
MQHAVDVDAGRSHVRDFSHARTVWSIVAAVFNRRFWLSVISNSAMTRQSCCRKHTSHAAWLEL